MPPGLQGDIAVMLDEELATGLYPACCRPSLRALMEFAKNGLISHRALEALSNATFATCRRVLR